MATEESLKCNRWKASSKEFVLAMLVRNDIPTLNVIPRELIFGDRGIPGEELEEKNHLRDSSLTPFARNDIPTLNVIPREPVFGDRGIPSTIPLKTDAYATNPIIS